MIKNDKIKKIITLIFLSIEFILFILILTIDESYQKIIQFSAIILCFMYSLIHLKKENLLFSCGLMFTVMADLCLVLCNPIERLGGMIFFLIVQTLYSIKLHTITKSKVILGTRLGLITIIELVGYLVLKKSMDLLVIVSLAYYVMLILNIVESFTKFKHNRILPIGLILFVLCDTVIGLQVMSDMYLKINETSIIYKLIFSGFDLAWFFYLPSQVLISLNTYFKGGIKNEI